MGAVRAVKLPIFGHISVKKSQNKTIFGQNRAFLAKIMTFSFIFVKNNDIFPKIMKNNDIFVKNNDIFPKISENNDKFSEFSLK